jgi:hypothetical protein
LGLETEEAGPDVRLHNSSGMRINYCNGLIEKFGKVGAIPSFRAIGFGSS